MKIKAAWIEYIINPSKKVGTGEPCFTLTWRSSNQASILNWHGIVTEEDVKSLLSRKQFNEWKAKKRNSFVKHLTVQERKTILKNNNKKKDGK